MLAQNLPLEIPNQMMKEQQIAPVQPETFEEDEYSAEQMDENAPAELNGPPGGRNLVNVVKKLTNIEFLDRMSNLVNDKG